MGSTFTANILGNDASTNKYRQYIAQNHFVNQLDNTIRNENSKNRRVTLDSNSKIAYSLENTFNALENNNRISSEILSKLGDISSEFQSGLSDVTNEIHDLLNLTDDRLTSLIEGQKITHLLLNNVQTFLRLPDEQKKRAYHIE